MPLIMITGYPSSGKTRRAEQLKRLLEDKIKLQGSKFNVVLINDESLNIAKETYRGAQTEKATRGAQMAAVKRSLSRSNIVILDNLTYIKGFRYQLFCEAKAVETNSCCLHVGAPKDICAKWNSERKNDAWPDDLFEALVFRYEEPNGMAKWDSPLFAIGYEDEELPIDEIWDQLILRKPKPPNQATSIKPVTPMNYLTELDRITMATVNELLDMHKTNPGGLVKLEGADEMVQLPYQLTLPELNRKRRTFIALNKMKPIEIGHIKSRFVDYVRSSFDQDN